MTLTIVVPGPPVGQGRPRFTRRGFAYTPPKTRTHAAYIKAMFAQKYPGHMPLEGPVEMEVIVVFPVPKSASKKRRQAMLWGHEMPTKKPDSSNAMKLCEDALNGIAYRDDAQIVLSSVAKQYGTAAHTEIKIRPFGEEP